LLLAALCCWWVLSGQGKENRDLQEQLTMLKAKNNGENGQPNVEQVLGEIERIDKWKQNDVNWLEELYQYTQRALTPDDSIVDHFDAELSNRSGAPDRPFVVNTTRGGFSEDDRAYPIQSTLNVGLQVDDFKKLQQIDTMAREFIIARNAKLMNLDSTSADPVAGAKDPSPTN